MAYSCLLRNPLPWLVVLGSLLAFSHSTNFGFLTILLTSSALILCPVIILRAKRCQKKSITREDSCGTSTEEVVLEPSIQDKVSSVNQSSSSSEEELKKEQKEDKSRDTYLVRSSVEALLSDSESVDQTTSSEDSEVDWMFRENLSNDSINYSDGSISDEEELIEIALPTGHYVDSKRAQEQQSFFLILLMDFSSIVGASLHSPWMPFEALKWSSHKFKLMVDARKPMAWSSKIISKSPVERDEEPRINGIKKEDPNLFINIDINGN